MPSAVDKRLERRRAACVKKATERKLWRQLQQKTVAGLGDLKLMCDKKTKLAMATANAALAIEAQRYRILDFTPVADAPKVQLLLRAVVRDAGHVVRMSADSKDKKTVELVGDVSQSRPLWMGHYQKGEVLVWELPSEFATYAAFEKHIWDASSQSALHGDEASDMSTEAGGSASDGKNEEQCVRTSTSSSSLPTAPNQ